MNFQEKIDRYYDEQIGKYDRQFNPEVGLLRKFDRVFTAEYLAEHFTVKNEADIHSYIDSLAYALSLFFMDRDIERAQGIVENFCRHGQVNDADSPDYGELFWFKEEKHIRDHNGNFFNGSTLFLIRKLFEEKLTADQRNMLDCVLRLSYDVFIKERAKMVRTYVNPSLGKCAMCALLAEHFDLPTKKEDLDKFLEYADFLLETGINETLSPTYYSVDIIISLTCLMGAESDVLKQKATDLLNQLFFKQSFFFRERFPVPFRRGYNGFYKCLRNDEFAQLMGWIDSFDQERGGYLCMVIPPVLGVAYKRYPELFNDSDQAVFPRELKTVVYQDCFTTSYLDQHYALGSFNLYPPETTVWQTVAIGGSGWQDGTVYLTFNNQDETSMILRLEAIDENGREQLQPYEGDFDHTKWDRLYPQLSFPPEPKLRCIQKQNNLLCLFKTDRIDAVVQRFGFNLHFTRFNGQVMNDKGHVIELNDTLTQHNGSLLIRIDKTFVFMSALSRVDMGASDLRHGEFLQPHFLLKSEQGNLDCGLYNYNGEVKRFSQNFVSGGFFLRILHAESIDEALMEIEKLSINEQWYSDQMNAHIDKRDSIRKVNVSLPETDISIEWNHYNDSCIYLGAGD